MGGGHHGSPFSSCNGDALDEGALGEEEEEDDRCDDDRGGGHQHVPLRAAVLALVELEAERQGERLLVGQVEERSQEVVPDVEEVEERDDRERGLRERED